MGQTEEESFEILNLVRILIAMLKANGKLIAKMGEVEKKFPEEFGLMKDFSAEKLDTFVDKAPPEIAGLFLKIMLRATTIGPKMNNAMKLSADEKIRLGKEISKLVRDLETLLEKVEEVEK